MKTTKCTQGRRGGRRREEENSREDSLAFLFTEINISFFSSSISTLCTRKERERTEKGEEEQLDYNRDSLLLHVASSSQCFLLFRKSGQILAKVPKKECCIELNVLSYSCFFLFLSSIFSFSFFFYLVLKKVFHGIVLQRPCISWTQEISGLSAALCRRSF